jgi:hypothetical protein
VRQAQLALLVAKPYISEIGRDLGEKAALKSIERVVAIAKSAAGRNAARRFDLHFLDALPTNAITSTVSPKFLYLYDCK